MKSFNYYHEANLVPLNGKERIIKEALSGVTGYDLIKQFSPVEEQNVYWLIDQYGDKDGDYFTELDDVIHYITNNSEVAEVLCEYMEAA